MPSRKRILLAEDEEQERGQQRHHDPEDREFDQRGARSHPGCPMPTGLRGGPAIGP